MVTAARRIPGRMLPHLVQIGALKGGGTRGPIHAPFGLSQRCYIEGKSEVVTTEGGQSATASGFVIVDPETVCPNGSRLTLFPGQHREQVVTVVSINDFDFPGAPSHRVIYYQ